MAPLTLEQVLARSLRLPTKRINKSLFQPKHGGQIASALSTKQVLRDEERKTARDMMLRMEALEDSRLEDRPRFPTMPRTATHHGSLVRNSQDLLTHLQASKKMGNWEDALDVFSQCHTCGITPNIAHITVLSDALFQAHQFGALQTLLESPQAGTLDARREVTTHVIRRMVIALGWEKGLHLLSNLPSDLVTTESYNEVVAACSRLGNWKDCIRVIADMGLNDLSPTPIPPSSSSSLSSTLTTPSPSSVSPEVISSALPPTELFDVLCASRLNQSATTSAEVRERRENLPSPDAVTWASLVSVLQESGKQDLALHVLLRLPPRTRELILTSTVALIHVWSKQRSKRGPHY